MVQEVFTKMSSIWSDSVANQLAGLAVMGGANPGQAMSQALTKSAEIREDQRQEEEYQRSNQVRAMLPQLIDRVDVNNPQEALIKLAPYIGIEKAQQFVQTAINAQQEQRLRQQSEQITKYKNAPSGYEFNFDGTTLSPIPGGPKDATPTGKSLPPKSIDDFTEQASRRDNFSNLLNNFSDEFGGYKIRVAGDAMNLIGRTFGDESGQAQWWQQYQEQKNEIRNKLFGSALTNPERIEFDKANIDPSMAPVEIKKNLARQSSAVDRALQKRAKGYKNGGYNVNQIDELIASPIDTAPAANGPAPVTLQGAQEAGYPKKVRNPDIGKKATVNSEEEELEAAVEGYL